MLQLQQGLTRAHGCKEQRSGVTTQNRRAPPARATNPRTGGHRPKKRPLRTGIPVGHFLTWQASSNVPHWCPTWCRRSWYVGLWSTTASMSRYSRSWYSYAVACSVLLSFSASLVSCLSSSSACRLLVSWRGRPFLVAATPTHPESVLRYAQNLKDLAASTV